MYDIEIIKKSLLLFGLDDFEVSHEDIKKAYRKKIAEYHPDKVSSLGKELQDLANEMTIELNKANEYLQKHYNPMALEEIIKKLRKELEDLQRKYADRGNGLIFIGLVIGMLLTIFFMTL